MTDAEEPGKRPADANGSARPGLRLVDGQATGVPPARPPVMLRREFKGLTVADMLRDEIVDKLPGQARSALRHIEHGDYAAAERALPGHFAPVYAGPWQQRSRRRLWLVFGLAVVLACASALALLPT